MFGVKVSNLALGGEVCWRQEEAPVMTSAPQRVLSGFYYI